MGPTRRITTRPRVITARKLVAATSSSAATLLWLAMLGLITTPYLLHELGQATYGVFALITIVFGYLSNLEFGFGHGLVRFGSQAHALGDVGRERLVLETSFAVFLAAGTIASGTVLILAPHIVHDFAHVRREVQADAVSALRIAAASLLLALLNIYWSSALLALSRFSVVVAVRAVVGTLFSLSAVVTVALGGGITAILVMQLLISCGGVAVLAGRATAAHGRWLIPRVHLPTFRAMARFSVFIFVGGLAYQVLLQGPPTVLARHVDTAALAAYAVPAMVLQYLVSLIGSASIGFLPLASSASSTADNQRLAAIFRSHLRMTVLTMGPITAYLVVFAEPLLAAWINDDFARDAAGPLRFLSVAGLMLALSSPAADVARGKGKPDWTVAYTLGAGICALIASIAMVEDHGPSGVAAGTALALGVTTIPLIVVVGGRLLAVGARTLISSIAPALLAAGSVGALYWLGSTVLTQASGALLVGLLATSAHVLISYRYVLTDQEREAVRPWLPRSMRAPSSNSADM